MVYLHPKWPNCMVLFIFLGLSQKAICNSDIFEELKIPGFSKFKNLSWYIYFFFDASFSLLDNVIKHLPFNFIVACFPVVDRNLQV